MEKALNFQVLFMFPFWVQTGVANANMYVKLTTDKNCDVKFTQGFAKLTKFKKSPKKMDRRQSKPKN